VAVGVGAMHNCTTVLVAGLQGHLASGLQGLRAARPAVMAPAVMAQVQVMAQAVMAQAVMRRQ
jgi:hypothetical protein